MDEQKKKVFVAMSGGVDSAVAAGLLTQQGYDVTGVTMVFQGGDNEARMREAVQSARDAAEIFHIHHQTLDMEEPVNNFVIRDFVAEYRQGRTPNPCVRCNRYVKFGVLFEKAMAAGADYLATGHYARVRYNDQQGIYELCKGKDAGHDQSYFLYGVRRDILPKVLFPLGDLTKDEVREMAKKLRLQAVARPESQDICFINDGQYQSFLRSQIGPSAFVPGPFKDEQGKVVGQHRGIMNYTIGQRERLGLSLGRPVYVYCIEVNTNTIYVGNQEKLFADGLWASQFNPLMPGMERGSPDVSCCIRYNAPGAKGRLEILDGGRIRVDFDQPQKAVTPGQSVMFYRGETVLGGAVIDQAIRSDE